MGFFVKDQVVIVDHSINDFAITQFKDGYTPCSLFYKQQELHVYSIYYRPRGKKGRIGDNCPLLYALKNRDGLKITRATIRDLRRHLKPIIEAIKCMIQTNHTEVNYIVPMPSSHPYAKFLAKILQRDIFKNAVVIDSLLVKKTNEHLMTDIQSLQLPPKEINELLAPVKRAIKEQRHFSMASFKTNKRKYISPLRAKAMNLNQNNFLLIDDLVASGSTLFSAKKAIKEQYSNANIFALSLFSPINNDSH